MKLADLLPALPQCTVEGVVDREIGALRYDSRRVVPGDVFFAWRGEAQDGHRFIHDACVRGAAAVVLESDAHEIATASFIRVPDARRALALMAGAYYGYPARELSLVGVTGTNGKTTTAFAVQHLLRLLHPGVPAGMIGTVRYDLGDRVVSASRTTPEGGDLQEHLAAMLRAGCRAAAMEVSSHALDQGRIEGISFDAAIFTNLTPDHLDYHETMEAYFAAKRRLFEGGRLTPGRGAAVINLDDPYGRKLFSTIPASEAITGFSASGNGTAHLRAENVHAWVGGTEFDLVYGERRQSVRMPLIGKFNVANILGALGAVFALGLPFEKAEEGLAGLPAVPGRLERFGGGEDQPAVVVDYAHTEDAMRKALRTLRDLNPRRLSIVIGCGGDRDKTKRPKMAAAAVELADRVYFTADNPRGEKLAAIFADMKTGVPAGQTTPALWIDDRREAIARAIAEAGPGDIVCVAGKGHEATQEVYGIFAPFDDREIAAALLAERGGEK